jgi:hypothetical protein
LRRFAGLSSGNPRHSHRVRARRKIDEGLKAPTPLVANRGRPPDPRRRCPVEQRTCERHGLTEFAQYSAGPSRGPRWCCKRCVGEAVTRRKQKLKRILVEEAGGRCAVCGYDRCMVNLGFHHVDPTQKSFAMSMSVGRSLEAFREEARKCVLVCANCHGEIETGILESPPLGSTYATWGARQERY